MKARDRNSRYTLAGLAAKTAVLVIVGMLAAGAVSATDPSYATYMRIHGDWVVLCGRDEPTGRHGCVLKAPPPALGVTRSEIEIAGDPEAGAAGAAVTVRIGHPVSPSSPVYLRVDANAPHQAQPTRTGEAEWRGAEAAAILAELGAGRALTLRSFTATPAKPVDEWYSIALFPQALLDYRGKAGS